jgi:putative ABC transport system substrate-binding protein
MKRRNFIRLLGGTAATLPFTANSRQSGEKRLLGILMAGAKDADGRQRITALSAGLQKLGWLEGHNLSVALRWGGGGSEGIRAAAAEIVRFNPDVIMVNGTRGVAALLHETREIPIVFAGLSDPVMDGFVQSIGRPGRNVTGFTNYDPRLIGKQLELLKQISPKTNRVVLVNNPDYAETATRARIFESAASALNVTPISAFPGTLERSLEAFGHVTDGGMIVVPSAYVVVHQNEIIAAAARYSVPAVYPFRQFTDAGGLMFYGADILDVTRRSAIYIDRILKGEKPTDLPVQMPTKFQLVLNLKTAKALGLTVPPTLLAIVDAAIN